MATAISTLAAARPLSSAGQLRPYFGAGLLLLTDGATLLLATTLGAGAWSLFKTGVVDLNLALALPVVVTLLGYAGQGLYSPAGFTGAEQLRRIFLTTTLVYLALTAALFLAKEGAAQSRGAVVCAWILSILLVPLVRAGAVSVISHRSWWGAPVVLVGGGPVVTRLLELFRARPELGFKPIAIVDKSSLGIESFSGLPVFRSLDQLRALPVFQRVRHAVVAGSDLGAQSLLDSCAARFPTVLVVPDLRAATTLWISPRDLGGALALELRHNLLMPFHGYLKRLVDLAVSLAVMPFALPVIGLSALWIFAVTRQSPFFAQHRQSCNGRRLTIYKLRTMFPDADMMLLQFLSRSDDARGEWAVYRKLKHDPRVLPGIGVFLRRSSLDELPQLWNILKGEMSIVGPRPVMNDEVERYGALSKIVGRVKPGLTGLWQVSGRNDLSYEERIHLDSYYVRNWSIWLDISIIAQTLKVLVCRHGAY